jgi:hypothetical protein
LAQCTLQKPFEISVIGYKNKKHQPQQQRQTLFTAYFPVYHTLNHPQTPSSLQIEKKTLPVATLAQCTRQKPFEICVESDKKRMLQPEQESQQLSYAYFPVYHTLNHPPNTVQPTN